MTKENFIDFYKNRIFGKKQTEEPDPNLFCFTPPELEKVILPEPTPLSPPTPAPEPQTKEKSLDTMPRTALMLYQKIEVLEEAINMLMAELDQLKNKKDDQTLAQIKELLKNNSKSI